MCCHQGSDTPAEGVFCQQEDEHWREGKEEAAKGHVYSLNTQYWQYIGTIMLFNMDFNFFNSSLLVIPYLEQ